MKIIEGVIRAENPTELLSPALAVVWTRALTQQWTGFQPLRTILCGHLIGGMLIEANREHPENATLSLRAIQTRMALLGPKQVDALDHHLSDWVEGHEPSDHPPFYAIEQDTLRPLKGFIEIADSYAHHIHTALGDTTGLGSFNEVREAIAHHTVETIAEMILMDVSTLRQGALFCSTQYRHMCGQEWVLLNDLASELDITTSRVSESLAGAMDTGFIRHRRNPLNTRMTEIRFEWPTDAGIHHIDSINRKNAELLVDANARPDHAFNLSNYDPISRSSVKLLSLTRTRQPLKVFNNR